MLKRGRKMSALAHAGQSDVLTENDQNDADVLQAKVCGGIMATAAKLASIWVVCNTALALVLSDFAANGI